MREAAAERAAHPDREVADARRGLGQQAMRAGQRHALELRMADERVQRELALAGRDGGERGDAADVDEVRGTREPVGQHRQQALAAREQLGVLAALGEQLERLLRAVRAGVRERRRLHDAAARSDMTAATIGV